MKTKVLYILMIALIFTTSCEDYLEKNPLDQISAPTFWKTEKDAEMALTACYGSLQWAWLAYLSPHWEGLSDNAYCQYPWEGGFTNFARGVIEPTSGGVVGDAFYNRYQGITTCNIFLKNIEGVEIDQTTKEKYMAEVRFVRAYLYFHLTEIYGGVPLVLEPLSIENSKVAKSSKAEVVAKILEDLDFAISKLPNEIYTGHAVKASALAFKSRVLLFNGQFAEAASVAKQVVDGSDFGLNNNYSEIFTDGTQAGNNEIIFSIKYLAPDNYTWMDIYYDWWLSCTPVQDLVDAYECTDGFSIAESGLYDAENPYNNRDPRLGMTVMLPEDEYPYVPSGLFKDVNSKTGFGLKKFISIAERPVNYSTQSQQDWVAIRYAEVLLNYAEAQNEAAGPDQSVYDAINEIRARVDMPALQPGLSKEQMREKIRNERRIEMAMEGMRYFDLKRWNIAHEIIPQITDPGGTPRNFEQKHYLWPFPQGEIDINDQLEQNNGY